jgi:cell wall-associated NlpC family hydrolase
MRRSAPLIACLAVLLVALPRAGSAQHAVESGRKPFAAFSASAQRLRDSLSARVSVLRESAPTSTNPDSATTDDWSATATAMLRDSIVSVARTQLGARYRLGAQAPGKAFDCSGLVRFVLAMLHLDLPRTAHEQAMLGEAIPRDTAQLRPGDLLTFGTGRRITHIGIYAGDGMVIHASTRAHRVIETPMARLGPSLLKKWQGARRMVALADSTP